jgi:hypothetical protein
VHSAAAHGLAPERAQLSVAELLGRDGPRHSRPYEPAAVPETWPLPVGTSRLRLARTAGAYIVAGSVVCAAAFGGHPSDGPTMGTETADGGPPAGARGGAPEPLTRAEQPRTTASDRYVAPSAPSAPRIRPTSRVVPAAPRPARRTAARQRPEPVDRADEQQGLSVPAGSALSSLTRPILGSDSLLGPLG